MIRTFILSLLFVGSIFAVKAQQHSPLKHKQVIRLNETAPQEAPPLTLEPASLRKAATQGKEGRIQLNLNDDSSPVEREHLAIDLSVLMRPKEELRLPKHKPSSIPKP